MTKWGLEISETCKSTHCYNQLDAIKQSEFEYRHSVTDDLLLMISQTFAFYILLEIFEEKNRRKWYNYSRLSTKDDNITEPEVMEEKKQTEEYIKRKE